MSNYVNNKNFNILLNEYEKLHVKCEICNKKLKLNMVSCPICETKFKPLKKGNDSIVYEREYKKLYNKLGNMFLLIAQNLLNKSNFINYTNDRKNEMISDATFYMCKYIDRYDINRDNPFSYFTRIAFNAFLQYLNDRRERDEIFYSLEYIENFSETESFEPVKRTEHEQ